MVLVFWLTSGFIGQPTVAALKCSHTKACDGVTNLTSIADGSCNGISACEDAQSTIGSYSCDGYQSCQDSLAVIGSYSCVYDSSCFEARAADIGNDSCIGTNSCRSLTAGLTIGSNACNGAFACDNRKINGINVCEDPKGDGSIVSDGECSRDADGDRTCCTPSCIDDSDCEKDFMTPGASNVADISCFTHTCVCNENRRCQKVSEHRDRGATRNPELRLTSHKFDFHGECDLVLFSTRGAQHSNREDNHKNEILKVHIRTTQRPFYSYIDTVGIQVGGNVVTIDNNGLCRINGISFDTSESFIMLEKGSNTSHHSATRQLVQATPSDFFAVRLDHMDGPAGPKTKYTVTIGPRGEGLEIVVWDAFVYVNVTSAFHSHRGVGYAMSTLTEGGKIGRDMLDRQGLLQEDMDPSDWAWEWQVRPEVDPDLFETARAPQYPDACWIPDPAEVADKQLTNAALTEMARSACANWGSSMNDCVHEIFTIAAAF